LNHLRRIFLAAGVVLFFWLVFEVGPHKILDNLSRVGWGFLLVAGFQFVPLVLNTLAWRAVFRPEEPKPPFRSLLAIALSGDAINAVTPAAVVGGDLVRIGLAKRIVSSRSAIGSVSLAAGSQFVAQALFLACAVPLVLPQVSNGSLRALFAGLLAVMILLLIAVLILARRGNLFSAIWRRLSRAEWIRKRWAAGEESWRRLDEEVFGAIRSRRGAVVFSVFLYFLGWAAGAGEVWLILFLMGTPVSLALALSIESLSLLIDALFFFVPARVGTQEGGKSLVFLALGLAPSSGFTLGFLRRLRELTWAAVGLVLYGKLQRTGSRREALITAVPAGRPEAG
jgi:putative membrane protein